MDVNSIAKLATHMSKTNLLQDINIRLLKNAMEHTEKTAAMMTDMAQIVNNNAPAGLDGLGTLLDIKI
jgi:hypothetical protein